MDGAQTFTVETLVQKLSFNKIFYSLYTAFEILLSYQSLYDTFQRNLYLVEQTPLSTPTDIVYIKQWNICRLLISFFIIC